MYKLPLLFVAVFSLFSSIFAIERPFILWTQADIAAMKQRMQEDPVMKESWARYAGERRAKPYAQFFKVAVLEDAKAIQAEKKYLLGIVGKHPKQFEKLEHGGRHFTCYLDVIRYDLLYDHLSPEEREQVEKTFRKHIAYQLTDTKDYSRVAWLPNMQWPRPMSAQLMAVALGDEALIREILHANGGFIPYMNDYLADGRFYFEEFGKQRVMLTEMMLLCKGLEQLGLNELGFGYTGTGGATMRKHMLSTAVDQAFPAVPLPNGTLHIPRITMGDAKGSAFKEKGSLRPLKMFQHGVVRGYISPELGGEQLVSNYNMNGRDHRGQKLPKLGYPWLYELAHTQWPDAGFDFFLAHMREFGQDSYLPTPYFGVSKRIAPGESNPPPAPSYVAPERGFAMLRAEESPEYWNSPAPAVALQFSQLYVHYVADSFSLLGYVAKNRPIYVNRPISSGYNGGSYDFNVRSHCGVVVDGLQAQPVGPVEILHDFDQEEFRYIRIDTPKAGSTTYSGQELRSSDQPKTGAKKVYPGTDLSRQLLLTDHYMIDVFAVESDRERMMHWLVHPLGSAKFAEPDAWQESEELQQTLFNVPEIDIKAARVLSSDADWSLLTLQDAAIPIEETRLGAEWYERKVGVKLFMLGEPGSKVFAYEPPLEYVFGKSERSRRAPRGGGEYQPLLTPEYGGVSIAVQRKAKASTFVALHVPVDQGQSPVEQFRKIGEGDGYIDLHIQGPDLDDRFRIFLGETRKVAERL